MLDEDVIVGGKYLIGRKIGSGSFGSILLGTDIETAKFWRGAGCEECRQFGYQGRKGIYELLLVSEVLRPLIMNRASATTIAQRAIEGGMRTLRTDGWNKVKSGVTTIEEVLRVTQAEEMLEVLGEKKKIVA